MKCQKIDNKSVRIFRIPFSDNSISLIIVALLLFFSAIAERTKAIIKNKTPKITCKACINVITKKYGAAILGLNER